MLLSWGTRRLWILAFRIFPILDIRLISASPLLETHGAISCQNRLCITGQQQEDEIYANHIFNSVHDALKLWGNALHHNGMSFFVTTIDEATEFYHGTSNAFRINSTEWLAFEPEHAMRFARPSGWRRRSQPSGTLRESVDDGPAIDHSLACARDLAQHDSEKQVTFSMAASDTHSGLIHDSDYGYFHTYRTKHDLRLLYVDGQSAAKSFKGTLDTQDVVLRNTSIEFEKPERKPAIEWDWEIAYDLCSMAQEKWRGSIDGILRMEGGFEVILCDFEKDLDVVEIHAVKPDGGRGGLGLDSQTRALEQRYDGIGGDRVHIDYEKGFVSMFSFPSAIYFEGENALPRIHNSSLLLAPVRKDINEMLLARNDSVRPEAVNWQAVAELIVSRYSVRLELMTGIDPRKDAELLRAELVATLQPYIDARERNVTRETERCAMQFLPSSYNQDHIAARAVEIVASKICSTLFEAAATKDNAYAVVIIQRLASWLDWADLKRRECRGCSVREVCRLPVWPNGSQKDMKHPSCGALNGRHRRGEYWDIGGRKMVEESKERSD